MSFDFCARQTPGTPDRCSFTLCLCVPERTATAAVKILAFEDLGVPDSGAGVPFCACEKWRKVRKSLKGSGVPDGI
jgi:hypothetical protein